MSIATQEQTVVDKVEKRLYIGGEWRDAGGATRSRSRTLRPASRCARSPTPPRRTPGRRWTPPPPASPSGRPRRPTSAARSCGAPSRPSTSAPTSSRLLMTLEMGKAVAESKAEIAYAAEFFRWFSGEALRIDGNYKVAGNARQPGAGDAPAGRSQLLHHPVELPDRDGHAQDRPRDRRRLHDGHQAGAADAAVHARPRPDPGGVRASGRRPQRDHQLVVERRRRADHRRPAAAQAELHRLDRGGPQADRPGGRQRAQRLDGAGRQRPLPDLRRRRPGRRGRGGDDRQDAQHRRGLHVGQPLPRRRHPSPATSPPGSPSAWAR